MRHIHLAHSKTAWLTSYRSMHLLFDPLDVSGVLLNLQPRSEILFRTLQRGTIVRSTMAGLGPSARDRTRRVRLAAAHGSECRPNWIGFSRSVLFSLACSIGFNVSSLRRRTWGVACCPANSQHELRCRRQIQCGWIHSHHDCSHQRCRLHFLCFVSYYSICYYSIVH